MYSFNLWTRGFSDDSMVKNPLANVGDAGDMGSITG